MSEIRHDAVTPPGYPCGNTEPHAAHDWTYLHPDDVRHCNGASLTMVKPMGTVLAHGTTD